MTNSIETTITLHSGPDVSITIVCKQRSAKACGFEHANLYYFWYKNGELAGDLQFSRDKTTWAYSAIFHITNRHNWQ